MSHLSQNKKLNALFLIQSETREVVGKAVSEYVRNHLLKLNKERHRGLSTKGFYAQAADSVHYEVKKDSVFFRVTKVGLAQRLYGGTIKPKNAKALTIPNWKQVPQTANKSAGEFSHLKLILFKARKAIGALVEDKPKKQKPKVFYWLVKSVTQRPDKTVMPSNADISDVAYKAVLKRAKELGL